MKILILTLSLMILGCAHENTHQANFKILPFEFKDNSRTPASTEEELITDVDKIEEEKISDQRLYFLSLYTQVEKMQKISFNTDHELRHCPAYHTDFLEAQKNTNANAMNATDFIHPVIHDPSLYPFLTVTKNHDDSQSFMQGVEKFKTQSMQELKEICEYGHSNRMFVYQNLQDHLHNHREYRLSRDAVEAMIKVPVFANMLFLGTLFDSEKKSPYHLNEFETELVSRMKGDVLPRYLDFVYERRYHQKNTQLTSIGDKK